MAENTLAEQTDRLEEIIAKLEDGELSLERANEVHDEGQPLIRDLEGDLDNGDRDIYERETESKECSAPM